MLCKGVIMLCRFCRARIREDNDLHIHEVGTYTCPLHPETIAMPADLRWAKVFASVSEFVWPYEDQEVVPERTVIEFLIEVRHDGMVWYSRILVSEEELNQFPELYGLILDKMVENIDERLNDGSVLELDSHGGGPHGILPGG